MHGTSRLLEVFVDMRAGSDPVVNAARKWLLDNRAADCGWPLRHELPPEGSTAEETAWALFALLKAGESPTSPAVLRAVEWLTKHQDDRGTWKPSVVGLYFDDTVLYRRPHRAHLRAARAGPLAEQRQPVSRSKRGGLPPGPRLPAIVQTVLWAVAPVRFGKVCLVKYGPLFTMRIVGFGDTVYVCTPDLIHKILRDEDGVFDAAVANKSIKFVVGEHSLLLSGGATHAERRRLLMQPLHGSNIGEYVDLMVTIVEQEIRRWEPGSTVRLLEVFQRVTLEVMIRAVFGISDSTRLHRLRELVPKLLDIDPAIIVLPWLRRSFGGFGPWAKLQSVLLAVDEIILAEIADRRATMPAEGRDLLSILLMNEKFEVSARELRDHLVTLLAVGQGDDRDPAGMVLQTGAALARRVRADRGRGGRGELAFSRGRDPRGRADPSDHNGHREGRNRGVGRRRLRVPRRHDVRRLTRITALVAGAAPMS